MFNDTRPSPKPEELSSVISASSVPQAQKPPATPISWSSQVAKKKKKKKKKKSPSDYERDTDQKYAVYFKDNEILSVPELVDAMEQKTVLRSHRLMDQGTCWPQKTFEDLLKTSQIDTFAVEALLPGMF